MGKIIVAGHIALDITPVFKNNSRQSYGELLRPGKLIRVGEAEIGTGGAVSNTGLALHKLGAQVCLMSSIGEDQFGRILKNKIVDSGCEFRLKEEQEGSTSYTIVIAPKGLDRIFLHDPGCNDLLGCEDIELSKADQGAHLHFGYPTLMKKFYQNEGDELVSLMKKAKEFGLTTSLDLAAVDPESEAANCDWVRIFEKTLPYVDFFVPSIEELGFLINRPIYQKWQEKAGDDDITLHLSIKDDLEVLADQVLAMGAKVVLLKCGIAGMYLKTAPEERFIKELPVLNGWGGKSIFEDSFVPDRVRSAKGAGDSSIGAFIKAVTDGYSPEQCLQFAAATGACCVTEYDTISGLLTFDKITEKITAGWPKQRLIKQ